MNCPKCGGEMWDNTTSKKNPKAPDYKCKDKNCVDEKGFVTGVWIDNEMDKAEAVIKNNMAQKPADSDSMYKCNAMNNATQVYINDKTKSLLDLYTEMLEILKR